MTRACYALTLLLVAFGGSLLVTSPARCQIGFDYNHYGPCYHEACPFVDGYMQTNEEVTEPAQTEGLTDDADLRGRMVVAILDDPIAMDANHTDLAASDEVEAAAADDSETALAADSEVANIRSSSAPVDSVNSSDEATDVYNYGYRYEYMSKHGYYGQRYPEYYHANVGTDTAATPAEPAVAPAIEPAVSDEAAACEKPYDAYDYIHHYDRAYDATCCPAGAPGAAAEVAINAAQEEPPVARDCENEVYQAYLQRCAEEAVAEALVVEPVEPVVESEPYDPYGYEYRYVGPDAAGDEAQAGAAVTETTPAQAAEPRQSSETMDEYAPYEPYDAQQQPSHEVYGYEYDYEYRKEYGSYQPTDETMESQEVAANTPLDIDVLPLIDLGRDVLSTVVESELVDMVREQAEQALTQVAQAVDSMGFDQIRHDATQALAAAIQQPLPAPSDSDWTEADVYVFTFDSDLNAEAVAPVDADQTPWMVETEAVQQPQPDEQNTATVEPADDESVTTLLPIQRDVVIQWTRRVITSVAAAWDRFAVALQQFADRSVATAPGDDPSSTTQR